jgi:hypothetical protein
MKGQRAVATGAPLPQPMLAKSGPIPRRGDRAFEAKGEGFRAIVSGGLRTGAGRRREAAERAVSARQRAWVKTTNRAYWRYEIEREGALKVRRSRQFV